MSSAARDPDFVLSHADYVRGLVRELVFDRDLAADVEQETWLAALEHAPRDSRFPRAWLKRLVRNFAYMAWRGAARREGREQEVAREHRAVPTPAEILERESLRREIVEAVLALDEPVRSAMVLHYLEQRTLADVAAALGVPLETARSRVKRGIELLRVRLRKRDPRGAGAWSVALVELWRMEPPSYTQVAAAAAKSWLGGVLLMGVAPKVGVAVAAAMVIGAAWWFASSQRAAEPLETSARSAVGPDAPARGESGSPVAGSGPSREPRIAAETPEPAEKAAASSRFGSLLVHVRFAEDATPASGVSIRIHPAEASDYRRDRVLARTDGGGSALFESVPAGHVTVEVDRAEPAATSVKGGERTELALEIPPGVDLEGRTLDPAGLPVAGAEIYLYRFGHFYDGHVVARSDAGGRFSVRDVEADSLAWISARARGWAPTKQVQCIGSEGATATIDLAFEGVGGRLTGNVTTADGDPIAGAAVLVGDESEFRQFELANGLRANSPAAQRVSTDAAGRFAVEGVAPGTVSVQAWAKGFAPWTGEAIVSELGESRLDIALSRGATLAGTVRDGAGEPVARAAVHAGKRHTFAAAMRYTGADGTYAFDAVPVGDVEVQVEHHLHGSAETVLAASEGAALGWDAVLSKGTTLRGRVLAEAESLDHWYVRAISTRLSEARYFADADCGADGRFELSGCPSVPLRIEVYTPTSGAFAVAVVEKALAGSEELVIDVDESALPSVRLRGRVVDESGVAIPGATISPCRTGATNAPIELVDAESGRFDLGPYPPGTWSIFAEAAGFADARTDALDAAPRAELDFGDVVLERGGTLVARLEAEHGVDPGRVWLRVIDARGVAHWLEIDGDVARSARIPAGRNVLEVSGPDVALAAVAVDVKPEQETEVDLVLRRGIPVTVRIRNDDGGAIVSRVRIDVFDALGTRLRDEQVLPEDGGLARTFRLAPGSYRIDAGTESGASGTVAVTVAEGTAGAATTVELVLRAR